MHPILFKLGPLKLYTYGLFIALAFITGIFWSSRQAQRMGEKPERIVDLGFFIVIAALIGSRLLFILMNLPEYLAHPQNIIKIWEGGLVFHGGLIGGLVAGLLYLRKHHLRIWKYADILAPAIALGQGIGRIGCLMAGCCYGRETTCSWAIRFTDPNSLAILNTPLHPTQIYESIGALSIFGLLIWLRKRKSFEGQIFLIYVALYSVLRFTIDFFRGDESHAFLCQTFSFTQVLGMIIFLSAICLLWLLRRKAASRT